MERVITNQYGFRKSSAKAEQLYSGDIPKEGFIQDSALLSLKAKFLAFAIFLYFFFENGTLGLIPEKYYMVYRNVRLSDLILYSLVIYSVFCIREYIDLFKSKTLLITKLILLYLLFEFAVSAVAYRFNIVEYFFRLKGVWSSFLLLPYLLLLRRNGLGFLIKLIFPVAVISNILYILTAITGTAFLPDVFIFSQQLPGDMMVYRVFGGTFFGDLFFLGFLYHWFTRKFKFYQLFFAILFMIPQILAFGRGAWAYFIFTIFLIFFLIIWKQRNLKVFFRQAVIVILLLIALAISFIKFIPGSDYYIEALGARFLQGKEDIKYNEGTYAERGFQNNVLVKLWLKNNLLIGVGMHPMWVYRPESLEEARCYSAFSDVYWPSVLAAYGAIGLMLAIIFQFYYIRKTYVLLMKTKKNDVYIFLLTTLFSKLVFDCTFGFSNIFTSVGLMGLAAMLSFGIANFVFCYESLKSNNDESRVQPEISKSYQLGGKYYSSSYRVYKLKD